MFASIELYVEQKAEDQHPNGINATTASPARASCSMDGNGYVMKRPFKLLQNPDNMEELEE